MKKIRLFVALSALLVFLGSTTSFACGDKFVVRFASVMRARMALMAKPWAILMYYDQNSKATENALGTDMLRALKSAGLNVRTVSSREEFEGAIQNDMFDVILVGYSAAGGVEKALSEAGKKGKIVPIVDAENDNEKNLAKERYGKIIEDNDRMSTKLQMLSEVLQEEDNKAVRPIQHP